MHTDSLNVRWFKKELFEILRFTKKTVFEAENKSILTTVMEHHEQLKQYNVIRSAKIVYLSV